MADMEHSVCKEYVNLKPFNTLGINATARYLYPLYSEVELPAICQFADQKGLPLMPLGAGSNIVLHSDPDAVVMPILCKDKQITIHDDEVLLTASAGHNWHELVRWTLQHNYYGLENLSLIPGTAGAAPIQNIGAYGVEIKDSLVSVRGYCRLKKQFMLLTGDECEFGYRDSIFKRKLRNTFIITQITLRLSRTFSPNLSYDNLHKAVSHYPHKTLTALMISDTVCTIRKKKLPDPKQLGNVGSFFKNPLVTRQTLDKIRKKYTNAIAYTVNNDFYKLAAGWLIDACGLKGYRKGDAGVFQDQALVLVNYGKATGKEMLALAQFIQQQVFDTFNVLLEVEPCIYPYIIKKIAYTGN
ncbi:MAG: UDP-N-acetylmuramate dehydrogenase [Endozoicomonadaceae bacterium]|nr:UDP-N-acetylmuramate dehydrogenase [Endozoicomonadaceae bacterium]